MANGGLAGLAGAGQSTVDVPALLAALASSGGLQGLADRDPEAADRLMDQLGYGTRPAGQKTNLYWDTRGTRRVAPAPAAPGADYMRLVDSLAEAREAFDQGERPLLTEHVFDVDPDTLDPAVLTHLQESQWAAPDGIPMFTDQGVNPEWEASRAMMGSAMPRMR